jgi:hypothetical protein
MNSCAAIGPTLLQPLLIVACMASPGIAIELPRLLSGKL